MGEARDMAGLVVAPICQHEIYALAERLGFNSQDNVYSINLKPSQIEVTTVDTDEHGKKVTVQGSDGTRDIVTTTHLFAYTEYGVKWQHPHD